MSKIKDGIIGHAIGDAMGVPVEFCSREELMKHPVTDMTECYNRTKGTWSDDTSMEIATIDSFIKCHGWNYNDIMDKYVLWLNNNEYTARGETFDVGRTCLRAINNYYRGFPSLEAGLDGINSNGNGSLMRILPAAYYAYYKKFNNNEIYELVKNLSSLTHRHEISILGCYIYVLYVIKLLNNEDKYTAYENIKVEDYSMFSEESLNVYNRILKDNISKYDVDDIKSSGYVVDSLEAAMWVTLNASNYKESIIGAVNLGEDTDTIAAITGSMTGIIYGYDSIPEEWVDELARRKYLEELCDEFENEIA